MAVDLKNWRTVVKQVVGDLANESLQRRAWFGVGPEESSPDEDFCQFFGDAAVEEFLDRRDAGLSHEQREAGRYLLQLMREIAAQLPQHVEPASLIDDPRWEKVRKAAQRFHQLI